MIQLGVNIDHIATLRQVRGTSYPSPVEAALLAETAGADFITLHLREDRRHIQDADVSIIRQAIKTHMNLEMAMTEEMLDYALMVKPYNVCLVPEKRQELTTEGGLDVVDRVEDIKQFIDTLRLAGIQVSLFIDADPTSIDAACEAGANAVELHTGCYANAPNSTHVKLELDRIANMASYASSKGLLVCAGHGLHYHNVKPIALIPEIAEINIGHAIISEALMVGLASAVQSMKRLIEASFLAR